jgi:hypothetical protein
LGREEEVEHAGWEDLEVVGLEETSDGGQDSEKEDDEEEDDEEEGHKEGARLDNEGVGMMGLLQDPNPHINLGAANSFAPL